ncbi:MAG TPA: CHASE domain-containing protein [Verrucomicrobiae bacterium]|nr:CHASE domain-containing protein [Verrucomicrobiae bacterium]
MKAVARQVWFPLGVLLAGLTLTIFATYFASRTVHLRNRAEFDSAAQRAQAEIGRSLETYIALMRGVAGLFASESNITHPAYSAYVNRLQLASNYPGVQGIGFSLRVPVDDRASMAAWLSSRAFTNVTPWPDTPRDEYHAVVLLEPQGPRNRAALGYDMFSDPVRRQAMEMARDTARPVASRRVRLVQEIEEEEQPGFLIYTPVYEDGNIPETIEERRARLKGFAYCPFRIWDFIRNALDATLLETITLEVHDGETPTEANLVYRSGPAPEKSGSLFVPDQRVQLSIAFAERRWTLVCSSSATAMFGWWAPYSIAGIGTALSLLLFYLTSAEARARARAETSTRQLQKSEAALRDSETRLRLIVESARDYAIFALDIEGRVVSWNSGAERLFGYTETEIVGRNAGLIFTPEDRIAGAPEEELMEASKTGVARSDRWHERNDGSRLFVSGIIRVMDDSKGHRVGYIKVARDVTEKLEAEASVRRERDLSEMVINSLPGVFYLFDQNGNWVRWNKNLENITGYSTDEVAARRPIEFCPPDDVDRVNEAIRRVFEIGHATVESNLITRDGSAIPFLWHGRRIVFDGIPCCIGMGVDITERKRAESELRTAQEQLRGYAAQLEHRVAERTAHLRQSLQSLESLLYHVAHDLRAPLRSMSSFTTILLDEYAPNLDDKAQDYAQRIGQSAQFMDELVQDLLTYGHLAHSKISVSNVNLETQVDTVLKQLSARIAARNAVVEVERPLPNVKASSAVVSQIVMNLVDNALKFVPAERTPHVRIHADSNSGVRLWVEDNGIGIRPEYHERIFRVFERLHAGNRFPGTGIGLAIVSKGAERIGARAGVESNPGEGSRFWVEFPAIDGN